MSKTCHRYRSNLHSSVRNILLQFLAGAGAFFPRHTTHGPKKPSFGPLFKKNSWVPHGLHLRPVMPSTYLSICT